MEEILREGLPQLGLEPDGEKLRLFRVFADYLSERNAVMNLTSIEGEEETARLHFLDCCALLGAADFKNKSVIDIGSGAGFPGIPIKIMEPTADVTLLDSNLKKIDFAEAAIARCNLDGAQVCAFRAEEIPDELRGSFDIAVSRAVARLNVLAELCLPYVKTGGLFIAMKGPECEQELSEAQNALKALGGDSGEIFRYDVPGAELSHVAVVVKKIAPTDEKYPRRWAKISKSPL